MSSVQYTATPPSFGWNTVVYPASDSLLTLINELCFKSGKTSISLASSFNPCIVINPFSDAVAVLPVGIITTLFDATPVFTCGSSSLQKLDVAPESITADLLSFVNLLFLILRAHFIVILLSLPPNGSHRCWLLFASAFSLPRSNTLPSSMSL